VLPNILCFFNYRLQQIEDVLEEEKSLDILQTQQEFSMVINQVSNFFQRLEKHAKGTKKKRSEKGHCR
jgi:hypothetical protein